MLLQTEPSVAKFWNLLGRLHEIHVAAKRDTCNQFIELTWSSPRVPCCCKESHLLANYGTYLVASTRSMLLQKNSKREPSVGKLWNLLGRLHEIHVAAKRAICRQILKLTWSPLRDPCCSAVWPSRLPCIEERQGCITKQFRARIFKCSWGPGIDSKELIPPACVAWRAGTITLFLLGS
jgi:hypothetical protein